VLHNFNGPNGSGPGDLTFDASGNLYGATFQGGNGACSGPDVGSGIVFELTPKANGGWTENVLHDFNNDGRDGIFPSGTPIFDATGDLYGTTAQGGTSSCEYGCGTVFKLTRKTSGGWAEKVLYSFDGEDGSLPSGLIFDTAGNLYGTTTYGGAYGLGTAFKITP